MSQSKSGWMPLSRLSGKAKLWVILIFAGACSQGWADILVGSGPVFSYSYSPRTVLNFDTNASNVRVLFWHEDPTRQNCSFIDPQDMRTPGYVTYRLQADPGHVIRTLTVNSRASLFNSGIVVGECSVDEGSSYVPFFISPPYSGTPYSLSRLAYIRGLSANAVLLRYTLVASNGFNYNVQFCRDCDDAPFTFGFNGTVVSDALEDRSVYLVRSKSLWQYWDKGTDLGTAWRTADFSSTNWASGSAELGYGDGDEATVVSYGSDPAHKYITTYFRRFFNVTNASLITNLNVSLLRDDGAIVYINGAETFRANMPAGDVSYLTLATNAVGGADEYTFLDYSIKAKYLQEGTNLLAVEIHQAAVDSSDISFDLELRGERTGPQLSIGRSGESITLSWPAVGFVLQEAKNLIGPWTNTVGGSGGSFLVSNVTGRCFYRLKSGP